MLVAGFSSVDVNDRVRGSIVEVSVWVVTGTKIKNSEFSSKQSFLIVTVYISSDICLISDLK